MTKKDKFLLKELEAQEHQKLYVKALKAGDRAHNDLLDIGPIGFAWVTIRPSRDPFAAWCKQNRIGRSGLRGRWTIEVSSGKQSYCANSVMAEAMAKVLRKAGLDCEAHNRFD